MVVNESDPTKQLKEFDERFGLDRFIWFHALTVAGQKALVAHLSRELSDRHTALVAVSETRHDNRLDGAFVRDETRFGNENAEVRTRLREITLAAGRLYTEISRSAMSTKEKHFIESNSQTFRDFAVALGKCKNCIHSLEFPEPVARKSEGWFSKDVGARVFDESTRMTAAQLKVAIEQMSRETLKDQAARDAAVFGTKVHASSRVPPGTAIFVTPDQVPGLGKPLS